MQGDVPSPYPDQLVDWVHVSADSLTVVIAGRARHSVQDRQAGDWREGRSGKGVEGENGHGYCEAQGIRIVK